MCCFLVCDSYENSSTNVNVVHVLAVEQGSDSAVSRFRYFHMTYMIKGTPCCWSSHGGHIHHLHVHDHVCACKCERVKDEEMLPVSSYKAWLTRQMTAVDNLCVLIVLSLHVDTLQTSNTLWRQEHSTYCILNVILRLCFSRSGLVDFL